MSTDKDEVWLKQLHGAIATLDKPFSLRDEDDKELMIQVTEHVKFFSDISLINPTAHAECCQYLYHRFYPKGQTVFEQGSIGKTFYIILEGSVGVVRTDLKRKNAFSDHRHVLQDVESDKNSIDTNLYEFVKNEVRVLSTGDAFGEVALRDRVPRAASIVAKTHTHLACLDKEHYDRILLNIEKERKAELIKLYQRVSILKELPDSALHKLHLQFIPVTLFHNQHLYHEGEDSHHVYLIKSGEIKLSKTVEIMDPVESNRTEIVPQKAKRKNIDIAILGEGEVFGEDDCVLKRPRFATATCKSFEVIVLRINIEEFKRRVMSYNEAGKALVIQQIKAKTQHYNQLIQNIQNTKKNIKALLNSSNLIRPSSGVQSRLELQSPQPDIYQDSAKAIKSARGNESDKKKKFSPTPHHDFLRYKPNAMSTDYIEFKTKLQRDIANSGDPLKSKLSSKSNSDSIEDFKPFFAPYSTRPKAYSTSVQLKNQGRFSTNSKSKKSVDQDSLDNSNPNSKLHLEQSANRIRSLSNTKIISRDLSIENVQQKEKMAGSNGYILSVQCLPTIKPSSSSNTSLQKEKDLTINLGTTRLLTPEHNDNINFPSALASQRSNLEKEILINENNVNSINDDYQIPKSLFRISDEQRPKILRATPTGINSSNNYFKPIASRLFSGTPNPISPKLYDPSQPQEGRLHSARGNVKVANFFKSPQIHKPQNFVATVPNLPLQTKNTIDSQTPQILVSSAFDIEIKQSECASQRILEQPKSPKSPKGQSNIQLMFSPRAEALAKFPVGVANKIKLLKSFKTTQSQQPKLFAPTTHNTPKAFQLGSTWLQPTSPIITKFYSPKNTQEAPSNSTIKGWRPNKSSGPVYYNECMENDYGNVVKANYENLPQNYENKTSQEPPRSGDPGFRRTFRKTMNVSKRGW